MNMDITAGWIVAIIAICFFTIHIVTSPSKGLWITFPAGLRWGFLGTGFAFLLWATNFNTLGPGPYVTGHINEYGLIALTALAYTFVVFTLWVVTKVLAPHGWERIAHAERQMEANPENTPVVMTTSEVTERLRKEGAYINGEP